MRYACLLVAFHACAGVAQDLDTTGGETPEPPAAALAYRPGVDTAPLDKAQAIWSFLNLPAAPYSNQAELAGVVSVVRLTHKIPKLALKTFKRAATLSKKGKHEEAVRELSQAIAIDPEFAEAYNNLGVQYYLLARPLEAQAMLQRAVALDPAAAPSYANLAAVVLALGDSAGAELLARRALTLDPRNAGAQRVLGALHSEVPVRP